MSRTRGQSNPAVVLLSGGLDSATTLALARERGFACHAISFNYGQRHANELAAAASVAQSLSAAKHIVVPIDLRAFGGSALTDSLDVPKDRCERAMNREIPITYVPGRNIVFLGLAVGYAETIGARDLFIGVNAIDYSGYPDCRPEFIRAFENTANLGTKCGVEGDPFTIHAPLIDMSKAEIIQTGARLGVDYSLTVSCYDPDSEGRACGRCDACVLRRNGFREAGVVDPTTYADVIEGTSR